MKVTKSERLKKIGEDSPRALWDTIKWTLTCKIRVPEGEAREQVAEILMEENS